MSTADAVDREAAWYREAVAQLPALLRDQGGPFDVVQAYWRKEPGRKRACYLTRARATVERTAMIRGIATYTFTAHLRWPVDSTSGRAEDDQRALDAAIDRVLARVGGLVQDKSHGGRFLSVGEGDGPRGLVTVDVDDAFQAMAQGQPLTARVAYSADDFETTG